MIRLPSPFLLSVPLVLVAACTAPRSPLPSPLPESARPDKDWSAALPGRTKAEPTAWLDQFDDASLRAAVREAITANPDLAAAAARMRQAKYRALRDGAARMPDVSAGLRSAERGDGASNWNFGTDYSLSLDVSWEPDLWGRIRDTASASAAGAQAAEADLAAARLSLAAGAARTWCNLLEAEAQVALGRQTVDSLTRGLATVDSNFNKGVPGVSALDVRLARTSLASGESNLQNRLRSRDAAQRSLEALLGRYPSGSIKTSGRLPALRHSIPAGLPSSLLLRRPDLMAAERRIAAALLQENAARKALLPSFRLTAGAGSTSPELRDLLDERRLAASLLQ